MSVVRPAMARRVLAPMVCCLMIATNGVASGERARYRPKNGVLNWKAVLFGGGFRVTTAIPLRGDFSTFAQVNIVRPVSLIGGDVSPQLLRTIGDALAAEFRRGQHFGDVNVIEGWRPPERVLGAGDDLDDHDVEETDPLDSPLRAASDLRVLDQRRLTRQASAVRGPRRTLVVRTEVIDYTKGNGWLQLLFLDLGNSVLTIRVSYFDDHSGEELGRSVISSDNSSHMVPSAVSPRSALSGIAEGLVDQVTRRKVASER